MMVSYSDNAVKQITKALLINSYTVNNPLRLPTDKVYTFQFCSHLSLDICAKYLYLT